MGLKFFSMGISPNMNVIKQLEFELTSFEAAVQYFGHYIYPLTNLNYDAMNETILYKWTIPFF